LITWIYFKILQQKKKKKKYNLLVRIHHNRTTDPYLAAVGYCQTLIYLDVYSSFFFWKLYRRWRKVTGLSGTLLKSRRAIDRCLDGRRYNLTWILSLFLVIMTKKMVIIHQKKKKSLLWKHFLFANKEMANLPGHKSLFIHA
jgi:hypothetical protein